MNYLFGKPVGRARPSADGPRDVFVLGAYPSALHVRWHVPGLARPVQAVAVDDEPEPFWTGYDEQLRIDRWLERVAFSPSWGRVAPCGRLNGSSGAWVDDRVLQPLGTHREKAWITDCLDTYFESTGAAARLGDPEMLAAMLRLGIPAPKHRVHPSEDDIVREALENHRERLVTELSTAKPRLLISLGNAALRVVAALSDGADAPAKLSPRPDLYGTRRRGRIASRSFDWIPLAHPASPPAYQKAHAAWTALNA